MDTCYDVHEDWMKAVATGDCTISLSEYYDNYIQAKRKAERAKVTVNDAPVEYGLSDFLRTRDPRENDARSIKKTAVNQPTDQSG